MSDSDDYLTRLFGRLNSGAITREEAIAELVAYSEGGLTEVSAASILDRSLDFMWRGTRYRWRYNFTKTPETPVDDGPPEG